MKTNKQKGVITLVVIFGVGLFALSSVLTISSGAITEIVKNRDIVLGNNSFHAAEASAKEGAYQYINQITAYTGGSLDDINSAQSGVEVIVLDWPLVEIKGSGDNNYSERNVYELITEFPEGLAFDYAVYAQYDLNMGGNLEVNGDIFANDGIDFNGASAEINGNAYSPDDINEHSSGNVNGTVTEEVESIPPPELDFSVYEIAALSDGNYYNDDSAAESYVNGNTLNGLIYVEDADGDKTRIGGAGTSLTGFIAVKGDLDLVGGTFNASGDYATIVVDGNLKIAGGSTVNGIVYVKGATTFGGGNNTINGSLISAGGASVTDLTGNATINFDPNVYANWQNLEGLNTTSSEEPRIIYWRED